jgi:hypothetical protein
MVNIVSRTKQVSIIAVAYLIILSMVSLIASSCSTMGKSKYIEPKNIAVKNSSGNHLSMVSLRGIPGSAKEPVRVGKISPVPIGATQIITRPSSPPPLPKKVIVSWIDSTQRQYDSEISLEEVLINSAVKPTNFLVFEIGFSGRINVYTE